MRFASLLPMLLLWLSTLGAQNNCQIFNLTATAVQVNPNACEYVVSLNFDHNGTTNQFLLFVNGIPSGVFTYNQLPLLLGPYQSNPNGPTPMVFTVSDALVANCTATTTIDLPPCGTVATCNITDLVVHPGACAPGGLTYALGINFQVNGAVGNTFDVFANGVFFASFPINALPLIIPAFPASGNLTDVIKVCISNHPDCCATLQFDAPNCAINPCSIVDLNVSTGDCTSDSTYKATVDFEVVGPFALDSFALWSNGTLVGIFGIDQLPLSLEVNWNGGTKDEVKVCLTNPAIVCCATKEYDVPDCLLYSPCAIKDFSVKSDSCTSDSTFHALLNFAVTDSTAVDSFDLWLNGTYWGQFGMDQLPLNIDSFPWNGLIFSHVKICTGNEADCCKEYQLIAPDCLPFEPCEIGDIQLQLGECTSDSSYKITINFNGTNPGNGIFTVYHLSNLIDTFHLSQLPLTLELDWNGIPGSLIRVCILGADTLPNNQLCCRVKQFNVPSCLLPCKISGLVLDPGGCVPGTNAYSLFLDFEVLNPGNDSFQVWGNGTYFGVFALNDLPLTIPGFPANGNASDLIKICIQGDPDCCLTHEFDGPNCDPPACEIFNLELDPGDCVPGTNDYSLFLDFEVQNPGSDSFQVWGNGSLLGTYALSDLPLTIPNFPSNGNASDEIKICIQGSNCCKTLDFDGPNCDPPGCEIFDVVLDPGGCDPNAPTFSLFLNFSVQNPGSDSFQVWGNGSLLGTYALSDLPLTIPNFPSNGNASDVIKICIQGSNCCKTLDFDGPNCDPPGCEIFDVVLDPGGCDPNAPTFSLFLNFSVQNPGSDSFQVWGNGSLLGTYALSDLPLTIPNFPSNGNASDVIKICIQGSNCCKTLDFDGPDCGPTPCEIFNVLLDPGDCVPGTNTFSLFLDFEVNNPNSDHFEVWGNGTYLGAFPLNALPIVIPNFPSNGNAPDEIKICITDQPNCCKVLQFQGPDCIAPPCEIYDVVLDPGDCNPNSNTYSLFLNFAVQNPGSPLFEVWGNGVYLGVFALNALPITIPNFPANGNALDVIKICIKDDPHCCKTLDFQGPNCNLPPCEIFDLTVETGDCNPADSSYQVWVNFQVLNPSSNTFGVWANGAFFGTYDLSQLPLYIPNFPWDGTGPNDLIKVCLTNNSGALSCCSTLEFPTPNCFQNNDCEVLNLHVEVGDCTSNTSYEVWVNFTVNNPPTGNFGLWANGQFFGIFNLNQLPLYIANFPWGGGAEDHIKVCFSNSPGGPGDCCAEVEFLAPDCLTGGPCEIFNLTVVPGDCNTNTQTYPLTFNFEVNNPGNTHFEVWVNNVYFGAHPLTALPFTIPNVPSNGPAADVIKVCINDQPNCCKVLDFQGPNCGGLNCDIFNLVAVPGQCTGDSTFQLFVNFQVVNHTSDFFQLWANGQLFGVFNLGQLPLNIPNFPWNGGNIGTLKVCMLPNNSGTVPCCEDVAFQVPDCLLNDDCHIFDLQVLHTPCLCGQFFAILTFQHQNGGAGGFDIFGNGNNYGTYPYSTPQPIILGPFDGDGVTVYEFAVVDHNEPDRCGDDVKLGTVKCTNAASDPGGSAKLALSPNPASNWLNVTALLENGASIGQANLEVYATDGRLVMSNTVANGSNFQLDVSNLPSGMYRLVLLTNSGRLEGTFAKQ